MYVRVEDMYEPIDVVNWYRESVSNFTQKKCQVE